MRVIVYTRPDGGTSVCHPAWNDKLRPAGDTDDALLERCLTRIPADAVDVKIVEHDTIPLDRTFRDAWKQNATKIEVDMPKAREIHMKRIRIARDKKLAELDVNTMKALGRGDVEERNRVEMLKQTLRDLPATFNLNVATPEELKALWPSEL